MKRDNKHQSTDRRGENGMMLAELKHLKAQIALKDKRIKELEETLAQVKVSADKTLAAMTAPVKLTPEDLAKVVGS